MDTIVTIQQFAKTLKNLDRWIEKAIAYAQAKKVEPDVFFDARLALDQYTFARQVQSACDQAKYAAAYLSGQKAPSHPDTEKTIPELRARIQTCLTYIEGFKASDFVGSEDRRVSPPWLKGQWIQGLDWLSTLAIPNFYFHVTTAYAILRHNGVDLGKMDYIGGLPTHEG